MPNVPETHCLTAPRISFSSSQVREVSGTAQDVGQLNLAADFQWASGPLLVSLPVFGPAA